MPESEASLTVKDMDDRKLLGRTSPMLSYFSVYNPSLGQSEENTKDQILYYTAKKVVPADIKMKQIGLAQALVNVTSTFSTSRPTENVHSQRNRLVFLQPEPGFWMHMCVELGIQRRQIKDAKGKEKLVTEYSDTELNDQALSALLCIGYEQFKLLNGTMSSILYGSDIDANPPKPDRQRTRSLMHAIEEFFSTWIWQWDFDRLDTMVFGAVFNGIPSQPILRSNYLGIHDLDQSIKKQFNSLISHLLVLDDEGSLIYRSPSLQPSDVRSLRKYILKRVESQQAQQAQLTQLTQLAKQQDPPRHQEDETTSKKDKGSSLKSLTKSLSQAHVFGYFSNKLASSLSSSTANSKTQDSTPVNTSANKSTSSQQESLNTNTVEDVTSSEPAIPSPTDTPTAPGSPESDESQQGNGSFLTGMVESITEDLNGDEHIFNKTEIIRVYLDSPCDNDEESSTQGSDSLTEYILVIYKDQSNLVWSFLLSSFGQDIEDLVSDIDFYHSLERFMVEQGMNKLITSVWQNIEDGQKRSLSLGKHYKCFYYDNTTLNMKSTIVDQQGRVLARTVTTSTTKQKQQFVGGVPMSNEMLLQILNVKEDFDTLQRTDEIYTRSTSNHWIVGKRIYSYPPNDTTYRHRNSTHSDGLDDDHEAPPDESPVDEHMPFDPSDYSEIYLVAAKKDVSLADVEENIQKVTQSLLDILHCD
ncbi:hypothetical protein [Absidia glauca]|uniref:CCZ1/INTU/HSP4 first Longin domain-containing protein n=1 Tax=Absidia glauca TaxID=4829 RepID=A0A163JB21_ABSGL|nr:hypothetical protein [Absidia glauca]